MKLLFLTSFLICASAFSQQQAPPPASLGKVMKAMKVSLTQIVAQSTDASKNQSSEKLSQDLLDMTKNAKNHMPDVVKDLPKDQQNDQQQRYIKMIDDVLALEQNLVAAFHNNDNDGAAQILKQLSQAKKDGHDEFKKD